MLGILIFLAIEFLDVGKSILIFYVGKTLRNVFNHISHF